MAINDDKNLPTRRPFTIDGTARVIDRTAQTATPRLSAPQTTPSPTFAQKALGTAKSGATKAGRAWTGLSGLTGLVTNAATPSEDYYERFGKARYDDSRGALGHFGVRVLGYASDVGNAMSGGTIGDAFFADKIRQKKEAEQAQNTPQITQQDKLKALSDQMATPKNNVPNPLLDINPIHAENPTAQPSSQSQSYAPQLGLGIPNNNPNYQALMEQINNMQQRTMSDTKAYFGRPTSTPQRNQQNKAQREELLKQATTVHKGAHGLTANQMRLAHELTNDDIKMEQERHLQQNNLNHQLLQEHLQQQGQNARTLAGEQGANARAVMNEQGQNNRFNTNFGLDMARFNQDTANKQHEFGLRGMELNAKLKSQSYDDAVKQELNSLYHNYGLAQTDEEKQALYDKLGFLTGKGGQKTNPKDYLMTVSGGESKAFGSDDIVKNPDRIIDTRTMQVVDVGQADASKFNINDPNHQAHVMELVKKETSVEGRKKLLMEQMGLSEKEAQIAIQNAMGAK